MIIPIKVKQLIYSVNKNKIKNIIKKRKHFEKKKKFNIPTLVFDLKSKPKGASFTTNITVDKGDSVVNGMLLIYP